MAEMDPFERRVAVTLLGYADEAAPTLDAASVARRAALAHPRRAAAGLLPWRLVAIPRVAWVLLLAGLLLAVIGGALVVGSQLQRKLPPRVAVSFGPVPTCPPSSNPDKPGPVDQARPPYLSWTAMAFDRHAGRLIAVMGDADGLAPETWTFDVCTNTWAQMHPNREPPSLEGELVYDVDSSVTIGVSSGKAWVYDLQANTWTEKGAAMGTPRFYDPVSGLVVASTFESTDLWNYDVDTNAWTPIHHANGPGSDGLLAYDASVDRVVVDASDDVGTWLFDIRTGTWSRSGVDPPVFSEGWSEPAVAYDEAAERTVFYGNVRWAAYDAAADRWESLGGDGLPGQLVYDAVNRRLVSNGGGTVGAFDLATREWTVLLEPDLSESDPCVSARPGWALDRAPASTDPDGSPWIRAASVTLHGGPFFTRVVGVADEPWSSTPPAAPATVIDGLFLPECQLWTDGTVWWEETTTDPASRAWIEIDLGGTFELDGAVVQADADDIYLLSYRDPETAAWLPLWDVQPGEAGGLATRPHQGDASARWPLTRPVVTDALRFEANSSCESAATGNLSPPQPTSAPCGAQYSVSEIAVFGVPAP
jgi:hypothetical protein